MGQLSKSEAQARRDFAYNCQVDAQDKLMAAAADLARAERVLEEAMKDSTDNPPSWLEKRSER